MPSSLQIVRKFFPEVQAVANGRRDTEIEVTKADGSRADVRNHKACALAVACKRALSLDGVIVSTRTVYLVRGKKAIRYEVRENVSREIVAFDRGGSFAPGTYDLLKPAKHKPRGSGTRHNGDPRAGNKRPRRYTHHIRAAL